MCGVVSERLRESCFPGCGVGHGRSFQETSFTDDRVVIADDARGGGRGRHRWIHVRFNYYQILTLLDIHTQGKEERRDERRGRLLVRGSQRSLCRECGSVCGVRVRACIIRRFEVQWKQEETKV